jgi:divalent metal cation (Fe/Co/Zn/Cd) transporter
MLMTAVFQVVIVLLSGSVALLADTIHNFGDAATAIPLWFAFVLARHRPSKRFTYGYGRMEDCMQPRFIIPSPPLSQLMNL